MLKIVVLSLMCLSLLAQGDREEKEENGYYYD